MQNQEEWFNQWLNYMDLEFQFGEPFLFTEIKGGVRQSPIVPLRKETHLL